MSAPGLDIPASDADRARALDTLKSAAGHLGLAELERRMDLAVKARSLSELAVLVWDLPSHAPARPPAKASVWRSTGFRFHAAAYGLVNSMLVGIWAITDVHTLFWPFFPIAGWGVGLGMHAIGAHTAVKKRQEKEIRALERASRREPPAPPPRSKARMVVMFTDIVESTRLTMAIGDEAWARVRARCRETMLSCYQASRGQEVSSHGDGFLARFPSAGEAVTCAAEIQRKLRAQREDSGFAPSVRIGINGGDAIEDGGDVLGTAVNLAARVTASAEPGEVLVTESVADQLDDRVRLREAGLREMKGLDRTVHVLSVDWD